MTWKMLDLFCGLGGVSNGFHKENFNVTGIDIINAPKLLNYKHKFIQANINTLPANQFQHYDVIWESPPCREFTPMAKVWGHKWKKPPNLQEGLNTILNSLTFIYQSKPKIWIMENHPNLQKYIGKAKCTVNLSKGMRRSFWSNTPLNLLIPSSNKPSIWKHSWNNKIRSWQRAKIPIGASQAFAKYCKLILKKKKEVKNKITLYLIERTDEINYDEYNSVVIRAKSKQKAWLFLKSDFMLQDDFKISTVKITKIKPSGKPKLILASYNAG